MDEQRLTKYIKQIVLPAADSHKGENGRVLVIGGSRLFHAASFWAAAMASKIVDMVHFSSPAMENNELMRVRAKEKFWDGIVVPWEEVEHYIAEDDCILIGPGMTRSESGDERITIRDSRENTREVVNYLLSKYPGKRWVVDGGALQEVDPRELGKNVIVTPNIRELSILAGKLTREFPISNFQFPMNDSNISDTNKRKQVVQWVAKTLGVTVLSKGQVDVVSDGEEQVEVTGGDPGMTKGGTGDVLAGIVAGLYAKSPAMAACVAASAANKRAGEKLAERVGPFYSAAELIPEVQRVLWEILDMGV